MAISIIEKVFGTTNPYSANYIDVTLRLTKSFIIVSSEEAQSYNDYVVLKYNKGYHDTKKTTWRYYKHLAGEYHEVDVPMKVLSRDNRTEIVITDKTMNMHVETRRELSLYGSFYDEVVTKYPEQELLLRTLISGKPLYTIEEIITKKNWTIINYDKSLIEPQEYNILTDLQDRIYQFSFKNLITDYSISDNLYMAALFVILYNFIFQTLLALRLMNAKTARAHSYLVLNYYASHHALDNQYQYLDDHQKLFLYINMKYLDSHSGSNDTFDRLIEELFTRKRIVAVNYEMNQNNEMRDDLLPEYTFKQLLLNNANFVYDRTPYTLEGLSKKEVSILPNNKKEYEFNEPEIDFNLSKTRSGNVLTKDLEATLTDSSNNVWIKLLDVLIDYWAVTTAYGYNTSFITLVDPVSGKTVEMSSKDAFQLYSLGLHKTLNIPIKKIPNYTAWAVAKFNRPSVDSIMKQMSRDTISLREEVEMFHTRFPIYEYTDTKRGFRTFVEKVYSYELGMWIYLSSTNDLWWRRDLEVAYSELKNPIVCDFGQEDVGDFLERIQYKEFMEYSTEQAQEIINSLLNTVGDDILEMHERNRLTQDAMVHILNNFKSYSTQMVSEYYGSDVVLIGTHSPFTSMQTKDKTINIYAENTQEVLSSKKHVEIGIKVPDLETQANIGVTKEAHIQIVNDISCNISSDIDRFYHFAVDDAIAVIVKDPNNPSPVPTQEQIKDFFFNND